MSSEENLLNIPPILPTRPPQPTGESTPQLERSSEAGSARATTVGIDPILPPPTPTPEVLPTSSRSLRAQSSRSKGKDPVSAVPGSSASPIIATAAVQALVRVGMAPAATGETAHQTRARHNENEGRLAEFLVNLEQNVAKQSREHSQRMHELTLLVREVRSACEQQIHSPALLTSDSPTASDLVDNPVVQQLRSAVVEDRIRISDMVGELHQLRTDIERQISRAAPSLPLIPQLPAPFSPRPKHLLDNRSPPPRPKRLRTETQQNADVLYGPVDPDGAPRVIASAAMELISGLRPNDVYSAKYAQNQPGILSIRFRNHETADRFIESIEENPILEGQTAIPAGLGGMGSMLGSGPGAISRQSSGRTPQDIIRGVGRATRRR
jgi:hypothetical protein